MSSSTPATVSGGEEKEATEGSSPPPSSSSPVAAASTSLPLSSPAHAESLAFSGSQLHPFVVPSVSSSLASGSLWHAYASRSVEPDADPWSDDDSDSDDAAVDHSSSAAATIAPVYTEEELTAAAQRIFDRALRIDAELRALPPPLFHGCPTPVSPPSDLSAVLSCAVFVFSKGFLSTSKPTLLPVFRCGSASSI